MTALLADILGYTRPYNEFEKGSIGLDQLEMCANGVKSATPVRRVKDRHHEADGGW